MIFACLSKTFWPLALSLGTTFFFFLWSSPGVEQPWVWGAGFGRQVSPIFSSEVRWSCASPRFPRSLHLLLPWCDGCSDALGHQSPRLAASHACCCAAGALHVAAVIKARSPLLPWKRSTPQILNATYSPVNSPKHSFFATFKQGFISQPGKMPYSRNTQQGECACTSFLGYCM